MYAGGRGIISEHAGARTLFALQKKSIHCKFRREEEGTRLCCCVVAFMPETPPPNKYVRTKRYVYKTGASVRWSLLVVVVEGRGNVTRGRLK